MDRISKLNPDKDFHFLYKQEKEKVLKLQDEVLKLKSHITYLEKEMFLERQKISGL